MLKVLPFILLLTAGLSLQPAYVLAQNDNDNSSIVMPPGTTQTDEAPPLHGAIPAPGTTKSTSTTNNPSSPQELLPTDTIPLGVDQYQPQLKPVEARGPVGTFIKTVPDIAPHKPCLNCTGIEVRIQNLSPNPIIVDASHAQAITAGRPLYAISEEALMKLSGRTFTHKQIAALATAEIGTLYLAEPILEDHFTTSKKDFPVSYGKNETRRRLEDRQLSRRIILPGEDTCGVIFFPGRNLTFNKISVPIKTYPQEQPVGNLDIFGSANQTSTSQMRPPQPEAKEAAQVRQSMPMQQSAQVQQNGDAGSPSKSPKDKPGKRHY